MIYSQDPLLELLRQGKVPGEQGIPKHIETVISNVFLFGERVYKVYKENNEFVNNNFVDISQTPERMAFSREDFEWNAQLAKEVYLSLQPVKVEEASLVFLDTPEGAEEFLLVTKRLPSEASVFEHLRKNDLTNTDYYEMGKQFSVREQHFIEHEDAGEISLLENMKGRSIDVDEWMKSVEEYLPTSERVTYMAQLESSISEIYGNDTRKTSTCIDFHSLNAFYVEQILYPFDCFSIKYEWRFGPALLNIYRFATDVFGLVGEKEFRAIIQGYHDARGTTSVSEEIERHLVSYAAFIMVPYLYMLGKNDPDKHEAAIRYHNFLRQYTAA